MNLSSQIPNQKAKLNTLKDIAFSSDDSFNSDNSFNSSVENDTNDDYKSTYFHLKEQMNQLFVANPDLLSNLSFDPFDPQKEEENKRIQGNQSKSVPPPNYVTAKNEEEAILKQKNQQQQQKSQLWNSLTRNIVQNAQQLTKIPTLDTVAHRLNVYEHMIEHENYVELLTKECDESKQKDYNSTESNKDNQQKGKSNGSQNNQNKANKKEKDDSSSEDDLNNPDSNIKYYSYKKKMQVETKERIQKQKEQHEKKELQKKMYSEFIKQKTKELEEFNNINKEASNVPEKTNLQKISSIMPTEIVQRRGTMTPAEMLQNKGSTLPIEFFSKRGTVGMGANDIYQMRMSSIQFMNQQQVQQMQSTKLIANSKESMKSPTDKISTIQAKAPINSSSKATSQIEELGAFSSKEEGKYKSKIGKSLYSALQQSNGDKESFKKLTQHSLIEYVKNKNQQAKNTKFPPLIPKFAGGDCFYLNQLLPDFASPFIQPPKSSTSDPIQEMLNYVPPQNSQESEFLGIIENISKGSLLQTWKEQQTF